MSEQTTRDLRQDPVYRYIKHLVGIVEQNGIEGEPVQLPLKAVMEAPIPDYMPVVAGIQTKFMFILAIYRTSGRWGSMEDAMPGIHNMIAWAIEER